MELFRLPHRGPVPRRAAGGGRQRLVHAQVLPSAESLQARQIVEVSERHSHHHGEHGRRAVQLDVRLVHHRLHLCRHGHAALRQGLLRQGMRQVGLRHAQVELYRLHAQLHDRVQGLVRRVDRVHVGLHLRVRASVRSVLPGNRTRRKSGHPQSLPCLVAQQLLRHGW